MKYEVNYILRFNGTDYVDNSLQVLIDFAERHFMKQYIIYETMPFCKWVRNLEKIAYQKGR